MKRLFAFVLKSLYAIVLVVAVGFGAFYGIYWLDSNYSIFPRREIPPAVIERDTLIAPLLTELNRIKAGITALESKKLTIDDEIAALKAERDTVATEIQSVLDSIQSQLP